jgi:outer membrane protein assembly factor BamB
MRRAADPGGLAALALVAGTLATAIAGCGGTSESTASAPPSTPAPVAAPPATAATPGVATSARPKLLRSWPTFGITNQRLAATNARTGITAAGVKHLHRRRIALPGTVDSTPVVSGSTAYVTTSYGKTLRVDVATGKIAWTFTPSSYDATKGSPQFTNASPTLDPSGRYVYTTSSDGNVHKLSTATGREASGWPVLMTRNPSHEKLASPLGISGSRLLVTTDGYIGDAPPYQGKVVTIDRASGHIDGVFNSLCSNRHEIIDPATCPASDSAIWGRSGVVVIPGSHDLLVASSNGPFDGRTNWGDSVLVLSPDGRTLLKHWTPVDQHRDDVQDLDVGSTSPALLGGGLVLQGGKDAKLHLLDLHRFHGVTGRGATALGGDLQILPTPGNQKMFSSPTVWHHGGRTTVYVATSGGTIAYRVSGRRLHRLWSNATSGTSPVVAGGLLYVYNADFGGLVVYAPTSGRVITTLREGAGHWQSPVVVDGRILLAEGNADEHRTSGVLDVWSRG